jgi:hypothetical protein
VLDGELVWVDDRGRPDFRALLYGRGAELRRVRPPGRGRSRRAQRATEGAEASPWALVPSPATSVLALHPIVGTGVALPAFW